MAMVICRARLSHNCDHAKNEDAVYPPDSPMASDGTWDGRTVICTPCYVRLLPYTPSGQGLLEELPQAIAAYRDANRPMNERVEAFINVNKKDGARVTAENRADGSVLMRLEFPNGDRGEAVLPPGRPIRWI